MPSTIWIVNLQGNPPTIQKLSTGGYTHFPCYTACTTYQGLSLYMQEDCLLDRWTVTKGEPSLKVEGYWGRVVDKGVPSLGEQSLIVNSHHEWTITGGRKVTDSKQLLGTNDYRSRTFTLGKRSQGPLRANSRWGWTVWSRRWRAVAGITKFTADHDQTQAPIVGFRAMVATNLGTYALLNFTIYLGQSCWLLFSFLKFSFKCSCEIWGLFVEEGLRELVDPIRILTWGSE